MTTLWIRWFHTDHWWQTRLFDAYEGTLWFMAFKKKGGGVWVAQKENCFFVYFDVGTPQQVNERPQVARTPLSIALDTLRFEDNISNDFSFLASLAKPSRQSFTQALHTSIQTWNSRVSFDPAESWIRLKLSIFTGEEIFIILANIQKLNNSFVQPASTDILKHPTYLDPIWLSE